jgi:hypothetical protein
MIIFYEKDTGKVIGTIEGRVHGDMHLNQWIGDRDKIDRIIINWVRNEQGGYEPNISDQEQQNILINIDKNPTSIYDYIIDSVSGKLIRKDNN